MSQGKAYPTQISAANLSCRGRHTFEIAIEGAPWLTITGPSKLEKIAAGEAKTTDALVDLRNLPPGEYRGKITIHCTSCPPPPQCTQNISQLEVHLVVTDRGVKTPPPPENRDAVSSSETSLSEKAPVPPREPIDFQIEEAFELDPSVALQLGYKSLRIAAGDYSIKFDEARKFGYTILNVEEAKPTAQANRALAGPDGFGIRIRIATRKSGCVSGIGFACPLVPASAGHFSDDLDNRYRSAQLRVLEDGKSLAIELTEPVPWGAPEWR